jgi:hypothetical protein
MAYWMVVRSVYSCIVTIGVNIRICRDEERRNHRAYGIGRRYEDANPSLQDATWSIADARGVCESEA